MTHVSYYNSYCGSSALAVDEHLLHAGFYSDWGSVTGGIPQGSALETILFLNNMPLQVFSGCLLKLADD